VILTASELTAFQRCPRRWFLDRLGAPRRWRAKALFERELRRAVVELSNGGDKTAITKEAGAAFLEACSRPGLDTLHDPYTLGRDYASMLATSIEAISRLTLLAIRPGPAIQLSDCLTWQCAAFRDESGALHRWVALERLDGDALTAEMHSWAVFGDCAAAGAPMTLHVVEIGRQSKGHQHCAWARAFKHPAIAGRFAFQARDGGALKGDWKPSWYQDSGKHDPVTWVDLMERDQVRALRHVDVRDPAPEHCRNFVKQAEREARRMSKLPESFGDIPMFRPACDKPFACVYQTQCFV
jgi:hypothetical protein